MVSDEELKRFIEPYYEEYFHTKRREFDEY